MYIFTESSNMKSFQYKYWFQYHLHFELYVSCNLMCKNAFLEKEKWGKGNLLRNVKFH